MPKTTKVTLAEREYTVTELPSRKNADWRVQVDEALGDVSSLLGQGVRLTNLQDAVDGVRALRRGAPATHRLPQPCHHCHRQQVGLPALAEDVRLQQLHLGDAVELVVPDRPLAPRYFGKVGSAGRPVIPRRSRLPKG